MMVSPGLTGSPSLGFHLALDAIDQPHDLDAVHRAILADPAGKRERLQHRRVALDDVGAGRLDLAEDVDAFGARHEDRVAIAQLDVLVAAAALEIADPGAQDFCLAIGGGSVGPFVPCAGRTMAISPRPTAAWTLPVRAPR